jgi:hypothetical protein
MRAMHVGEDPVVFDEATPTLEDGVVRERVRVIEVGGTQAKDSSPLPPGERPFVEKVAGVPGKQLAPRISNGQIFMSGLLSFIGIGVLSVLRYAVQHASWGELDTKWPEEDLVGIVGSMGASAVLIYGAPDAPFSQTRNLIGGHLLAGVVGVASWELFAVPLDDVTLAAPLAVSISIMLMHATRTLHPPAGGTALIAVMGSQRMHDLGFMWVLVPVFTSALLMLVVALVGNNLVSFRSYPKYWR